MKFHCRGVLALLAGSMVLGRAAAPGNDHFSNAFQLAGRRVQVTGSNTDATREAGEPNYTGNPGGKSVWWKWVAPASGSAVVQTTGSAFDTLLSVFTGSSLAGLSHVASNDDSGSAKTSRLVFNVTAGLIYDITVDGYNGASGEVQLALEFREAPIRPPSNDQFADRIEIEAPGGTIFGANFLAKTEPGEPNHASELGGASVWWTWVAPVAGRVEVTTEGSGFDTLLAVYTGSVLTNLTVMAGNDDAGTNRFTSELHFQAAAGVRYQIAVDGFNGDFGEIQLRIGIDNLNRISLNLAGLTLNGAELRLTGVAGKEYLLETSDDLATWSELASIAASTESVRFMDHTATNAPHRFYRAREAGAAD